MDLRHVKLLSDAGQSPLEELGGKGYSLAVLTRHGFNVPPGFVLTVAAFTSHLAYNGLTGQVEQFLTAMDEENCDVRSTRLRELVSRGIVPPVVEEAVVEGLAALGLETVSVRSSAVGEDGARYSFAGLHDTCLNVRGERTAVLQKVMECWASLFNHRAMLYRIRKRIPLRDGMAVVIQKMIPAEVSGVTFTQHPSDKGRLLIEASYGLGDMVVGGQGGCDDYVVDRATLELVEKRVGNKTRLSVSAREGTVAAPVGEGLVREPALSEPGIIEVSQTCLRIEGLFGRPQDVEWCTSGGRLWVLQSRPITGQT